MNVKKNLTQTTLLIVGGIAACTLCMCAPRTAKTNVTPEKEWEFTMPEIPAMLTDPASRAEFLVSHYWDSYQFADTTRLADTARVEQAFVDYIVLFPHTTPQVVASSIDRMMGKTAEEQPVFDRFTGLYEKYLYDANSPFRDEEYYRMVLESVIANAGVDDAYKIRPNFQMQEVNKNRRGTVAADFTCTLANGQNTTLHGIKADYTLLFFYDPGCADCKRVKDLLEQAEVVKAMIGGGKLKVLALYPEEEVEEWKAYRNEISPKWMNGRDASPEYNIKNKLYAVRALPSLYLMDRNKTVLLKDATGEQVIEILENIDRMGSL